MATNPTRMPATAVFLALFTILLWSFLALLGSRVNHLPSILVTGVALSVSGLLSLFTYKTWRIPLITLLIGIGGIFGYHFLFFTALSYAPVVEANLVNYLWPLLIVLLSPVILSGHALKLHHLIGAIMGLLGAGLIITGGRLSLDLDHLPGYLSSAAAALVWATYSLLTKRVPPFPTTAVGSFCLLSGFFSLSVYMAGALFSQSSPGLVGFIPTGVDWIYLILLGIGPLGAAFFTWDAALKRGDPRIIGSLAYITPLTSTIVLVLIGGRSFTWISAMAMLLIVSGALVGSSDLLRGWGSKQLATSIEQK
jgi:drug/metabolite transporter (DMT)-like permease